MAQAWYENEQFWIDFYPYMFGEERLQAAVEQVDRILALTGLDGGDVLDLCCGPGRHSVELAGRGWKVTGVDRTPYLLNKARERAAGAGVEVEFVEQDMREFCRADTYDLALSLFTSFGYFDTEQENARVLRNLHASLRPGGRLVLEVNAKEWIAAHFLPSSCDEMEDGRLLVQRRRILADWTRIENEWILIGPEDVRRHTIEHTIYSGRELRDLLRAAGFGEVRLYGGLDGSEYGRESKRLVVVGRR